MVAATIRKMHAPNHEAAVLLVSGSPDESSRSAPLRELSPLRTVRASFPAYGSSNMTVIGFDADKAISFTTFMLINLLFNYTFATGMYKCPHFSSIDNLLGDAPRSFTVYTFSTNRAYFILSFPNVY